MRRREFLAAAGAAVAGVCVGRRARADEPATRPAAGGRRPNIVLIVADDLGYGELACYGGRDIPTPHLDALAAGGARFTHGYASAPVCSPMRAGLMTGRYQQRFGHELNPTRGEPTAPDFGLPLDEAPLPQLLKGAGYATGMIGKWHLGYEDRFHPTRRGFESYYGFLAGAHSYLQPGQGRNVLQRGTEPITGVGDGFYMTDALTREAIAFIDERSKEPDRPFFLYLSYNAVHAPMEAPPRYRARFPHLEGKRQAFAAMLSAMDDGVGAVTAALKEHGIDRDTLVIFVSDNGGPTQQTTARNDPFRGTKGSLWEGGIRVPMILSWPGRIPAGRTIETPVISLDLSATALAAAGARPARGKPLDGADLLPLASGASAAAPHEMLFWRYGEFSAVRRGNEKMHLARGGAPKLFDLNADPGETTDLALERTQTVRELTAALAKWDAQLVPPKWGGRAGRSRRERDGDGEEAASTRGAS